MMNLVEIQRTIIVTGMGFFEVEELVYDLDERDFTVYEDEEQNCFYIEDSETFDILEIQYCGFDIVGIKIL